MSEIANSVSGEGFRGEPDGALEARILRLMIAIVSFAVIAGAMLAPWRVTAGLLLGGALSILNYHWLRTSVAAVFNIDMATKRPRIRMSRYIIRYFLIGIVAVAAYKLQMVSLPATIAGLCSFVPALFVEAIRQFYFTSINREESY